MKKSDLFFGAYQIAAGVISLATLINTAWARGATALVGVLAVGFLSIAAGVLHLKRDRSRFGFTIVNQLSQTVGVITPYLTFHVVQGAFIGSFQTMTVKASFAKSALQTQVSLWALESVCDFSLGRALPGLPTWGLSFNFLALALAWYAVRLRSRARAA